jgi:hypothetical protein
MAKIIYEQEYDEYNDEAKMRESIPRDRNHGGYCIRYIRLVLTGIALIFM